LRKCFQANPSVSCSPAFVDVDVIIVIVGVVVVVAAGHTLVGWTQSDISHIKKISSRIIFLLYVFDF